MAIQAVIFDFGNIFYEVEFHKFFEELAKHSGQPQQQLFDHFKNNIQILIDWEAGKITSQEYHQGVNQLFGLKLSYEDLQKYYDRVIEKTIDQSLDLVKILKKKYKLGLISNTSPWHFESKIEQMEIYPLFDAVTISYQAKLLKPGSEIYHHNLNQLQVRPEESLFVDDLAENVEGARKLGIPAVQFLHQQHNLAELLLKSGVRV